MSDHPQTFHWSPEIEEATVAILWREPKRLAEFLGKCDPAVHLFEPHCRTILDAVRTVYSETNTATWEDVVTCLREMHRLDAVGGKDGLNRVYCAHEPSEFTDQIFKHHIDALKTYAEARDFTPPRSAYQFIGGRGTAYPNKAKRKGLRADYTGSALIRGTMYQMSMDVASQGEYINVRFDLPTR